MATEYDIPAAARPSDCALCGAALRAPFCVHIAAGIAELERTQVVWIGRDLLGRELYNVRTTSATGTAPAPVEVEDDEDPRAWRDGSEEEILFAMRQERYRAEALGGAR